MKLTADQREVANRIAEGELLEPSLVRAYGELLQAEHIWSAGVWLRMSDELYAQTDRAKREFDMQVFEGNGE